MSDKKEKKEKRGLFGSKKSGDASTGIRKSKSFKRIRGLLKGSKSKKTLEKETKSIQEKPRALDEGDTVYDVDVEDRSVMTRQTVEEVKPFLLKIVLLLMDPLTRRFELLQLEFDSLKATVNDILVQIPVSVTEEALREQKKYVAICGPDAKEKAATETLLTFCTGNEVLVAIPEGLKARECVRLATPILSDTKVTQMLKASGINSSDWKDDATSKNIPDVRSAIPPKTKSRGNRIPLTMFLIALLGVGLQVFHLYISAPIQRGNFVSPNIWLRECGLNFFSCNKESYFRIKNGMAICSNGQNEVMWVMEGATCESGECQHGMQVKPDGSITIGNKPVTHVTMYKEAELSPWPFAQEPLVKIRHAKSPRY